MFYFYIRNLCNERESKACNSLGKKLEALKWVERGHTIRTVANELGVGKVTVETEREEGRKLKNGVGRGLSEVAMRC